MFCRQCGTELSEEAVYCRQCGTKVIKTEIGNTADQRDAHADNTMESQSKIPDNLQSTATWQKWLIGIIAVAVIGFCIWMLVLVIRWLFSSFVVAVIVFAAGYILYHKALAARLSDHFYN